MLERVRNNKFAAIYSGLSRFSYIHSKLHITRRNNINTPILSPGNAQLKMKKFLPGDKSGKYSIPKRLPDRPVPIRNNNDIHQVAGNTIGGGAIRRSNSFRDTTRDTPSSSRANVASSSRKVDPSSYEAKMGEIHRLREIRKKQQREELKRELERIVLCPNCDRRKKTCEHDILWCKYCKMAYTYPHIDFPQGAGPAPPSFPALCPLTPGTTQDPSCKNRFINMKCRGCHTFRVVYGVPGKAQRCPCGDYFITVSEASGKA